MTTTWPILPPESIQLAGISWHTYESLLAELHDRRFRLTYHHGYLEIMTPSPEHELRKKILGRLVETLAEETDLPIYPLGSTTLKRQNLSGAEPDECFYIRQIEAVQGKKKLDFAVDPAPDLVIEVDVTNSSPQRLQVYADLGVAEVWVYDGRLLKIEQLQEGNYITAIQSQFFPNLPIAELARFLQQADSIAYLELVKSFRSWVRSVIKPS
jgi:Uma2 family endonuclease